MRVGLAQKQGQKINVKGMILRFGRTGSGKSAKETIMLSNVTDEYGNFLCDHIWLRYSKKFKEIHLDRGDIIKFSANVRQYIKRNGVIDFQLAWPSQIQKIGVDFTRSRLNKDDRWSLDRKLYFARQEFKTSETKEEKQEARQKLKLVEKEREKEIKRIKTVTCPHCKKKNNRRINKYNPIKCYYCSKTFMPLL